MAASGLTTAEVGVGVGPRAQRDAMEAMRRPYARVHGI